MNNKRSQGSRSCKDKEKSKKNETLLRTNVLNIMISSKKKEKFRATVWMFDFFPFSYPRPTENFFSKNTCTM